MDRLMISVRKAEISPWGGKRALSDLCLVAIQRLLRELSSCFRLSEF
jgi:hypothetical protein